MGDKISDEPGLNLNLYYEYCRQKNKTAHF